jgi:hypothetical protein
MACSRKEQTMAIAYIQEFEIVSRSTANYDYVAERVREEPIEGMILHTAGFDDEAGVFRIFDIWESRKHADRFLSERIQPLIEAGPESFPNAEDFAPPTREGFYELYDVMRP